ncbi:uncharacterized protein LOC104583897 [Brachypodium distachyon]|uniref:DUF4220 domain-containing protein n=1 Tax=Brachypodium distachyon TaxID=15368 RepID=I1HVZ9_BRADI|nr:uncharacterized protein LOC104583897 [Brachypodium distachyon]PNT65657.1 hypothetical protein BRADI_3g00407v3 [Brachypodium distachyon]|eukprot:XP_010236208.2 uncharacterized protein LOC104583897 [Brachypodium distachyon]
MKGILLLWLVASRAAVAAAMYNSSAAATAATVGASTQRDIIIDNRTVCTTPTATLVASFTVSADMRTTERLMVTTTILMTFLGTALFVVGVLGRFSGRHRGHSTATCIFFRATFALFLPFMSYMFSKAKSESNQPRAQLILLWMLLVELLRKKVYAMVAPAGDAFARGVGRYSFFDAVEEAARMVWIGYLVYSYVHVHTVKSFFIILWIFSVAKMCKRAICIYLAKGSFDLAKNAALVSGYMVQLVDAGRQVLHEDDHALGSNVMKDCNYVVMGESRLKREVKPHGFEIHDNEVKDILDVAPHPRVEGEAKKSEQLVRVCNIWDLAENDVIFRYNDNRKRKLENICLALALFKLLRRKIEHFHMAEARTPQARNFVFLGLLALEGGEEDEAANAERAFEVVELELRFLDEYYQAVIPLALPKPKLFVANFAFSIAFILLYCITVLLVTGNGDIFSVLGSLFRGLIGLSIDMVVQYQCFVHQVDFLVGMVCSSSDLIVTFLLTLTLLAVETYEFMQYLLSDWFVASVLCNYARKPTLRQQRHIRQVVKGTLWVKHRSRPVIKVHQVTMLKLHQLHPRRVWMLVSRLLKRRLVGLPDAVVTSDAKVAIIKALKDVLAAGCSPNCYGHFSNGKASLARHGFAQLEWACNEKMGAATVIIVWHIATALFETRDRQKHPLPPNGQAALTLSRYCAYLVAYEPGLLPDDEACTEEAYKKIKAELNSFFQSCCTTVHRRERLMKFCPAREEVAAEKSDMAKGVHLGKKLEEKGGRIHEDEKVWEMLLDFWAELLVFIARRPSAGPEAHALALSNGGEFITHIWAMLTHAGVRAPKRHNKDQVPPCHPV